MDKVEVVRTQEELIASGHIQSINIKWFTAPAHNLFQVGRGDDDLYYAVRDTEPMFCFSGKYQEDAEEQAGSAIESYFTLFRPSAFEAGRKAGREEGAKWHEDKLAQLIAYRDECSGDGESQQHARVVVEARINQCRLSLSAIRNLGDQP